MISEHSGTGWLGNPPKFFGLPPRIRFQDFAGSAVVHVVKDLKIEFLKYFSNQTFDKIKYLIALKPNFDKLMNQTFENNSKIKT